MSLLLLACSCSPVGSTPQSESESESESDSPVDTPVDTELEGPHIPSFELAQGFVPIGLGRAVSLQDVDGDGDLDVLSASSGMAQPGNSSLQLHLQNSDGSYTWATESWGLSYDLDLWGLVPIDPDGDGVNQLLMTGAGWSGIAGNHLHTYIHTYIHTCIQTHIHTHTYPHTYIHTYIYTYIHTHTHSHTYIPRCTHTHTHTHRHTYIQSCIHAYIHT